MQLGRAIVWLPFQKSNRNSLLQVSYWYDNIYMQLESMAQLSFEGNLHDEGTDSGLLYVLCYSSIRTWCRYVSIYRAVAQVHPRFYEIPSLIPFLNSFIDMMHIKVDRHFARRI